MTRDETEARLHLSGQRQAILNRAQDAVWRQFDAFRAEGANRCAPRLRAMVELELIMLEHATGAAHE